jgi:hypothetical protein
MAPVPFINEKVPLSEAGTLPVRMEKRTDLLELSDCRVGFDLSGIPVEIGIPLTEYNPFDTDAKVRLKTALCPLRSVFGRVLQDGMSSIFRGNTSVGEIKLSFMPRQLGVSREENGARALVSVSCSIDGVDCGIFSSEQFSPWSSETEVPVCLYAAVADIGNQAMSAIADSRHLRDRLLAARKGGGTVPSFAGTEFSDVDEGRFSGRAEVLCGTWDMARVRLWIRSQLEQIAMAKLGLPNLENYRLVLDSERESFNPARVSVSFRVFPYQGFELAYDARTRRGVCTADLAVLGVSPEAAYARAVRFVETVLSDQGVVKTAGEASPPAQYRFEGYRTTEGGTKIAIPFQLVQ